MYSTVLYNKVRIRIKQNILFAPLLLHPSIAPMRLVALMFMTNSLMDLDMDTVVNNFFGGNKQIIDMLVDKNC